MRAKALGRRMQRVAPLRQDVNGKFPPGRHVPAAVPHSLGESIAQAELTRIVLESRR